MGQTLSSSSSSSSSSSPPSSSSSFPPLSSSPSSASPFSASPSSVSPSYSPSPQTLSSASLSPLPPSSSTSFLFPTIRPTQNSALQRQNLQQPSTSDQPNLRNTSGFVVRSQNQTNNTAAQPLQHRSSPSPPSPLPPPPLPLPQAALSNPAVPRGRVLRATPARAHRRDFYTFYPMVSGASTSRSAERPLSRRLQRFRNRNGDDGLVIDARRNASRNSLHSLHSSTSQLWSQSSPSSLTVDVGPEPMEDIEYGANSSASSDSALATAAGTVPYFEVTSGTSSVLPFPSLASSSTTRPQTTPLLHRSSSISSLSSLRVAGIQQRMEMENDHHHHHHSRQSMETRNSEDERNGSWSVSEGANSNATWTSIPNPSIPARRTLLGSTRRFSGLESNTTPEPPSGNGTDGHDGDNTSRRTAGGMRQRILNRILSAAMLASMNLFAEPSAQGGHASQDATGESGSSTAELESGGTSQRHGQLSEFGPTDPLSEAAFEAVLALLEGRGLSMPPHQGSHGNEQEGLTPIETGGDARVEGDARPENMQQRSQNSGFTASGGSGSVRLVRLPSSALTGSTNDNAPTGNDETAGAPEARPLGGRGVVPVIIIGIRSVPRTPQTLAAAPARVPLESTATTFINNGSEVEPPSSSSTIRTQTGADSASVDPSPADGNRRQTRSWIVYIISGPPGGLPAMLPENSTYEELIQLGLMLGPARPITTTQGEIDAAVPTRPFSDEVKRKMMGDTERCQICLTDYCNEEQVRVLKCRHGFHTECIDKWLTEGSNKCPICRGTPVEQSNSVGDRDQRGHGPEDGEAMAEPHAETLSF